MNQTTKQTNKQTDKQTDEQTDEQTNEQTNRQADNIIPIEEYKFNLFSDEDVESITKINTRCPYERFNHLKEIVNAIDSKKN